MSCQWLDLQVLKQGFQSQKKVQLMEGATVGDILKKVAEYKNVSASQLYLTEARWTDKAHCLCRVGPSNSSIVVGGAGICVPYGLYGSPMHVKLHRNEVPDSEVQIGGVDDLDDVPDVFTVEPKFSRTSLTKEECLAFQDDLISAYSEDPVQQAIERLQQRFRGDGALPKNKYARMLAEILVAPQRQVFAKWSFDPPPKGIQQMLAATSIHTDDDVQLKATIANGLLGLDLAWLEAESDAKALMCGATVQAYQVYTGHNGCPTPADGGCDRVATRVLAKCHVGALSPAQS
eukprot:CAMPEP_0170237942 /NCGR_PEP_ID=MMETSP0116_2-20130129/18725_1 /TAXON_ID=400756 /ORGANISM="Durinskia baltica, Strain CSIRO CS-38" /LENGTH=289 /DNA_ID=CAMNT_0010488753 /DNA_START=35 /DNA_END=902 /DNA_ORIENTATION=+